MAEQIPSDGPDGAPPISEQIHLPEPSFLPVVVAAGITIAIVGVVVSWVIFALGTVIWVGGVIRWVRDTRSDIAELPLGEE